jgi:hypothetical protein
MTEAVEIEAARLSVHENALPHAFQKRAVAEWLARFARERQAVRVTIEEISNWFQRHTGGGYVAKARVRFWVSKTLAPVGSLTYDDLVGDVGSF